MMLPMIREQRVVAWWAEGEMEDEAGGLEEAMRAKVVAVKAMVGLVAVEGLKVEVDQVVAAAEEASAVVVARSGLGGRVGMAVTVAVAVGGAMALVASALEEVVERAGTGAVKGEMVEATVAATVVVTVAAVMVVDRQVVGALAAAAKGEEVTVLAGEVELKVAVRMVAWKGAD